jgi:hypothetical protein
MPFPSIGLNGMPTHAPAYNNGQQFIPPDTTARQPTESRPPTTLHSPDDFQTDWRGIWVAQLTRLQEMTAEHDRAGGDPTWYKMMAENFTAVFQHAAANQSAGHPIHNVDPSLAVTDHDGQPA